MIATKNRKQQLRKAIRSALAQLGRVEVIVLDDASTDDTSAAVRAEFPEVRLYRTERSEGCLVQRNFGVRAARAELVVFLDDDAYFSTSRIASAVPAAFDDDRIGVVAIPLEDPDGVRNRAPSADGVYAVASYSCGASAVRREVFQTVGGFRGSLRERGEEGDLVLRLLDAGYITRPTTGDTVVHSPEKPGPAHRRADFYAARNEILLSWHNVPSPYLLRRLVAVTAKMMVIGIRSGRPGVAARGLAAGYVECFRRRRERRPVARTAYRLGRMLRRRRAVPLAELEPLLPSQRMADQAMGGEG